MTAWRMYRRTLDEESAAVWRAQGIGTETAVLATWIRREAQREGLDVHPTASVSIYRLEEGGVCVSIPVRADPDPLVAEPLDVDLPTTFDDHGSERAVAFVLGIAIVAAVAVLLLVDDLILGIAAVAGAAVLLALAAIEAARPR